MFSSCEDVESVFERLFVWVSLETGGLMTVICVCERLIVVVIDIFVCIRE